MKPSAPLRGRTARGDAKLTVNGKTVQVKAGTNMCINLYSLHHDPEYWPEPERFDPERFFNKTESPFTFLPFGAGARKCVGQPLAMLEAAIVVAKLLRRFDFELAPNQIVEDVTFLTMSVKGGLRVVPRRR
jgi:cytochrome P450